MSAIAGPEDMLADRRSLSSVSGLRSIIDRTYEAVNARDSGAHRELLDQNVGLVFRGLRSKARRFAELVSTAISTIESRADWAVIAGRSSIDVAPQNCQEIASRVTPSR